MSQFTRQKIDIVRGDGRDLTFALAESSDDDLTDATAIAFSARKRPDAPTAIWELDLVAGVTVIGPRSIVVSITAAMWDAWETAAEPGRMAFDIQTTLSGADPKTRARGTLVVEWDVTRAA